MFGMLFNNYCMEIAESIGWVALGFLPVFGSMEVGFKHSIKETIMKKVSVDALHK